MATANGGKSFVRSINLRDDFGQFAALWGQRIEHMTGSS
jgi:hypothetical protein